MKEMDCKQIEKNILFFIDKELSVANNIAFNAHLNNCEHCKLKVENISATYQSFDIVEDKLDDPYFYTRLKQKLENKNTKTPYFVKRILQPASLVSLLLLGIFTGIFIGSQYKSINSTSEEIRNSQIKTYAEENYLTELDNDNYEYLLTTSH
jgi:anti-sigma factor RsiW